MTTKFLSKMFVILLAMSVIIAACASPTPSATPTPTVVSTVSPEFFPVPCSHDNPLDPSLLEGKWVKVLYYEGAPASPENYSSVEVGVDGVHCWVKVGISIQLRHPVVENGITQYDYSWDDNGSIEYSFDDYTGPAADEFEGIWHNDPDHPGNFVDVYISYKPTEKDNIINSYWDEYQNGLGQSPYRGHWDNIPWDESPYARCWTMLANFALIPNWDSAKFEALFELCTGEEAEPSSIGYYWSVYGMGSGSEWGKIQIMTFLRQPPDSRILGTVTPCTTDLPILGGGIRVTDVRQAADDFSTIFSDWVFSSWEGYEIELVMEGNEKWPETVGVVADGYLGYTNAADFPEGEWGPADNRPGISTIRLWKVTHCGGN